MIGAALSGGVLVVFGLIAVALVLFVSELIPNDVTAIGIIVSLAALEPLTGVGHRAAISGFANTATVTIVAMYMLSAGIQQTGVVQRLGLSLAAFTDGDETRALAATIATTGPIAGFINNTPVVAIFIPMISDLSDETGISPSKLLLPLSYAAILGGTLTLVGTSTNLLASEFAATLLDRGPISMFEFSALGLVILVVGLAYLMTVGRWLTPARIPADADLVEEFDLEDHLTQVRVDADSTPIGLTVEEFEEQIGADVRVLQHRRDGSHEDRPAANERVLEYDGDDDSEAGVDGAERETQTNPERAVGSRSDVKAKSQQRVRAGDPTAVLESGRRIREGDVLTVHGTLQAVNRFVERQTLRQLHRESVTEETFDESGGEEQLAKTIVPLESPFVGKTLSETHLREFYQLTVLAIRRDGELLRTNLEERTLEAGDLLLVQTVPETIQHVTETGDLVVVDDASDRLLEERVEEIAPLSPKTPVALAIMAGVVGTAALGLVSIVIAAFAGVFLMIVTGCLSTSEAYDAVSWNIVFLLAGVIPLGVALEATGGSQVIAGGLVATAEFLPLVAVLLLFTIVTGLLANVITPVATVVLMIPIAVDAAGSLGATRFSFLLAVMFASATSFMTPVGYQTNLMVYGPGGYKFTDFLKVGGPLQLLLAIVTTVGITVVWGV
ncbi:SLC13 family permease [Natrinema longum]|uniref:SLC13 family permease n=1 Tax=Natrinema longum TaxID=370324 RepID=A0A8A2U6X8_9EURY|nr:SLC13 family permease [Natrinema longum]MBZ6494693.1 SLC13 family permease [Natrinema longum]QSW83995.1 SLC13 family permease [Natrinema longum]